MSDTAAKTVAPMCDYPLNDQAPTSNQDVIRWVVIGLVIVLSFVGLVEGFI